MKQDQLSDRKVNPKPSVVFTDLEDGNAVLLDLDSKFYYSLNGSGCFMWKVFENESSVDLGKLVDMLMEEYDVEEEQAELDVEEFISSLAQEGLVSLS